MLDVHEVNFSIHGCALKSQARVALLDENGEVAVVLTWGLLLFLAVTLLFVLLLLLALHFFVWEWLACIEDNSDSLVSNLFSQAHFYLVVGLMELESTFFQESLLHNVNYQDCKLTSISSSWA